MSLRPPDSAFPWYVETHLFETPEKVSLDLARHLPQRTAVGSVVIVTDRPVVMLPVIRKRWLRVIREVERQHSSTLDHAKRGSLWRELLRLRELTFAANTAYVAPPADIVFTAAQHAQNLGAYQTLYLLAEPSQAELTVLLKQLAPNGLIADYAATKALYL
jgi:hypothetical protein